MSDQREEAIRLIVSRIRSTRNRMMLALLLAFGFGGVLIHRGLTTDGRDIAMTIGGAIVVLFGLWGLTVVWPYLNPENAPLVSLLREHPEKIAWMYDTPDMGPRGRIVSHTVLIYDTDRRKHRFAVGVAEVEGIMAMLRSFAPKATVGFGPGFKEKYYNDPQSMIAEE